MRKFRLDIKKEDLFFSPREKKIFFIALRVGAGAVALGIVIVIVAALAGRPSTPPAAAREPGPSASSPAPAVMLSESGEILKPMTLSSFIIPDESKNLLEPEYRLFRTPALKWDQETVDRYWVPPSRIGLENLKKINDKNIEELFEGIQ